MRVACIGECMVELALDAGNPDTAALGFAGDSFNTAVYLRRAAPSVTVAYVTALGTDRLSQRMLARFAEEGLDTSLVEIRPGHVPGLYAIDVDASGERSFTYWRSQSAARTLFEPPARVMPESLAGHDLIYLSGISLAVLTAAARERLTTFLDGFRAGGGRVAFDSNYRPVLWPDIDTAREAMAALWARCDIGLPSLDDEMTLWGDPDALAVISRLTCAGVSRGAIKRGAEGPLPIGVMTDGPVAYPPAGRVVDTTAAGDSFNGAYLAALIAGKPEAACLRAGHDMAVRVIGHRGAIIPRDAQPAP